MWIGGELWRGVVGRGVGRDWEVIEVGKGWLWEEGKMMGGVDGRVCGVKGKGEEEVEGGGKGKGGGG